MFSSSSTLRRLACAFLCLGSSLAWSQSQPVFPVLHYDPYAVASPLAMADGDVNGDGVTDTVYAAASTSSGSSTLTSAPRDTTGATLSSIAAGSVPCTANSLLLADLNNDNHLDAIVTCAEDKLAVLAGNGDGTFQAATTFSIIKAAKAATADLNGDGYPEMVVATNTGTTDSVFAILINKGAGSLAFAAPQVYSGLVNGNAVIPGTSQLFISDLNGDGKADVIAGGNPDQISGTPAWVFYGNGDGTVHAETSNTFYLGNNLGFADFDGDRKTDAVRIQPNGNPVLTLLVVTFGDTSKVAFNLQIVPGSVRIQPIDLNGDGHPDIVLTGSITTVLLNDGAAHFSIAGSYATPGSFYTIRKGSAGSDLVYSTPRGLYTMHGDGQGRFDGLHAYPSSDQIATADFNKDGMTDVFTADQDLHSTRPVLSRGDGTFVGLSGLSSNLASFPIAGDFDGDGLVDRVDINPTASSYASSSPQARLVWYKGQGNGAFALSNRSILLGVNLASGAVAGDFDRDGKLDVVVSYFDTSVWPNKSGMVLVRGNGDGTFIAPLAPFYTSTSSAQLAPLASDLDNDGDLDIVWQNTAFINSGAAVFTPLPLLASGTVLAAGDLNGDSIPDLVIGNTLYSGNGDGTFQPSPFATIATPAGATFTSASIGDLDGDGHPDLVLQHMTDMAGFTIAYGDGVGNFTVDPNTYTTGTKTPVSGALVRLNNQATTQTNRLDYLVASDKAVISLLNQDNSKPGPPLVIPTQISLIGAQGSLAPKQSSNLVAQLTGIFPTGTVTFSSSDGTVFSKVWLNGQSAFLDYQFPNEGDYSITASYSGDGVNAPSTSAPFKVSVAKKKTVLTMSTRPGATFYTGYVSAVDLLLDGAYNPAGAISISSGGQTLGTVTASYGFTGFGYRYPSAGSYLLTATYPGDASNLPSTASLAVTVVDGPDFTMTASPATATLKPGETATFTLTFTSVRNYSGTLDLTCRPACPASSLYLGAGKTATARYTVQRSTAGAGGGAGPSLSYGPMAAAMLLFGLGGGLRRRLPHWQQLGLFAIVVAAGMFSLSGCSSGSSSNSGPSSSSGSSGQGTPYYLNIVAEDEILGPQHAVNLTVLLQ